MSESVVFHICSRRAGAAATEVEGTAINPRPRPRATDATPKQLTAVQHSHQQTAPSQPVLLVNTPITTPSMLQNSTQKEGNFVNSTPMTISSNNSAVATPSPFESNFPSERRNDLLWEQTQQADSRPETSSSLIDFDSSAVPSFGHMIGMSDGATVTPVLIQNGQYVNYGRPWGAPGFVRYPSANPMRYCTPPQHFVSPVPGGSMPASFCGASGFNQFNRHATTGFVVGQPMTGSNNELHLMQVKVSRPHLNFSHKAVMRISVSAIVVSACCSFIE